jgi:methionyl-tRNA synthetase
MSKNMSSTGLQKAFQDWDIQEIFLGGEVFLVMVMRTKIKYSMGGSITIYAIFPLLLSYLGDINKAREIWNSSEIYHFIGKDIVYHHYLFLPAIRIGMNEEYKLPDLIPTRGHLMLQNN